MAATTALAELEQLLGEKKGALPAQLGADVMALSQRIKDALDPRGILNPGAVL